MPEIYQMPLGPLQTNCYFLGCEDTMEAAIIDPAWNGRQIAETAVEKGYIITHILLTHAHFDHVGGLAELKQETNAPIFIHPDAVAMLQNATSSATYFGLSMPTPPEADNLLAENDVIQVGELELRVLFTPGHAPGHVCFYLESHHVLFDGDVLFQQSIGRTDLPGGNMKMLMENIRQKLLILPDETNVLSGHGPATTIGQEKAWNPFLK